MKHPFLRVFVLPLFLLSCPDHSVKQIPVKVPEGVEVPPEMVYIPGGEFIMGDPDEPRTLKGKKVQQKAFLIDRFEVSFGLFKKFQPTRSTHPKKEKFPVTHVDFFESKAYFALGERVQLQES